MSLVSVIIPTRNRADKLHEALQSILAQTYRNFEVIVIDDGSVDHTSAVVGKYGNRVTYLRQEGRGCAHARNAGISASRGAYVAFLDDDDVWYPRKLELQVATLEENTDVDFVYGSAYLVERESRRLILAGPPPKMLVERLIATTWGVPGCPSVVVVRRKTLQQSGFFDPAMWPFDDWELWVRIALCGGHFAHVSEPVAEYRMHATNVTHDRELMRAGYIAALEKVMSSPDCPEFIKVRRHYYFSRRWVRVGNERYIHLELDQAWMAWRKAVSLDPAVLTPQLLFLMAKSAFGSRMLGWARQTKGALARTRPI